MGRNKSNKIGHMAQMGFTKGEYAGVTSGSVTGVEMFTSSSSQKDSTSPRRPSSAP